MAEIDLYEPYDFLRLPKTAMTAFNKASRRGEALPSTVINWCIQALTTPHAHSEQLIWVPNSHHKVPYVVPTHPVTATRFIDLTVELTLPNAAAVREIEELGLKPSHLLACATVLASYFGRNDGRLGYGYMGIADHAHINSWLKPS